MTFIWSRFSLSHACYAARHNEFVVLMTTPTGGHAGFFTGWRPHPWMYDVAIDFISCAAKCNATASFGGEYQDQQSPYSATGAAYGDGAWNYGGGQGWEDGDALGGVGGVYYGDERQQRGAHRNVGLAAEDSGDGGEGLEGGVGTAAR